MLLDDIYVMWIPILVIALMAALGWWRGVYRELIVSAAIVLSALVALQWATQERWALDLSNTFNGLGPGEWQFFLTLVLVGLVVTVVGYGLGGLFARRGLSSTSRTLGALLGLMNGAALTGWVLRAAYEGLVDKQDTSAVYQNPISLSLMVWAGWFPVVLAVIGAIAALIYSVRGDNVVSVANTGNTGAHMTQATSVPSYAPSLPQLYQPAPIPPVQARVEHYAVRPSDSPSPGYAPTREQAAMAPTVANPVNPFAPLTTNAPMQPPQSLGGIPARPVGSTHYDSVQSSGPLHQVSGTTSTTTSASETSSSTPHTPPFGYDLAALWGQDEESSTAPSPSTTVAEHAPIGLADGTSEPGGSAVPVAAERRCTNCGNRLQPGAVFCTECGTRAPETI